MRHIWNVLKKTLKWLTPDRIRGIGVFGFWLMFFISAAITYDGGHLVTALTFLAVALIIKYPGPVEKPAEPKKRNGNGCR